MSLALALTQLGVVHRLTWAEVESLLDIANSDMERAIADVEFDAWWNGHVLATGRLMAIYNELLGGGHIPAERQRKDWTVSRRRLLSEAGA